MKDTVVSRRKSAPVVGITGGIACGKSAVGEILERRGVPVLDADVVAHACIAPGGVAYAPVTARFGREILRADGAIDRALLGARVFENPAELAALNGLVHPPVMAELRRWALARQSAGQACAVIIPLLFEVGGADFVDVTVCVAASENVMADRLRAKGWSAEQIRQRIAAQLPVSEKMKRADYILWNEATRVALEQQTEQLWMQITESRA